MNKQNITLTPVSREGGHSMKARHCSLSAILALISALVLAGVFIPVSISRAENGTDGIGAGDIVALSDNNPEPIVTNDISANDNLPEGVTPTAEDGIPADDGCANFAWRADDLISGILTIDISAKVNLTSNNGRDKTCFTLESQEAIDLGYTFHNSQDYVIRNQVKQIILTNPGAISTLTMQNDAFSQMSNDDNTLLQSVVFPEGPQVLNIGADAFFQCSEGTYNTSLKYIEFPEGVTTLNIGADGFRQDSVGGGNSLSSIKFPSTLVNLSIGPYAFIQETEDIAPAASNALISVEFPEGLKYLKIGDLSFMQVTGHDDHEGCALGQNALTSVYFPSGIDTLIIGAGAFGQTSNCPTEASSPLKHFNFNFDESGIPQTVKLGQSITLTALLAGDSFESGSDAEPSNLVGPFSSSPILPLDGAIATNLACFPWEWMGRSMSAEEMAEVWNVQAPVGEHHDNIVAQGYELIGVGVPAPVAQKPVLAITGSSVATYFWVLAMLLALGVGALCLCKVNCGYGHKLCIQLYFQRLLDSKRHQNV